MSIRTALSGDITIGENLRDLLCFTSDGALYVSQSHINNPAVRAFMARLDKKGESYHVITCEIAKIASLYNSDAKIEDDLSDLQGKAVDIFKRAAEENASDIHILVSKTEATKIKFRINGKLRLIEEYTYTFGNELASTIYHSLTDVSAPTFETAAPQDARISDKKRLPAQINGIRIATGPQVDGF